MSDTILIYGATGYTGKLTARRAKHHGMSPIIAGRNRQKVEALSDELGFDGRVASLDSDRELDELLDGVGVLIHQAGPFSATSEPMIDACLRNKVHYLDITGEIAVFELAATRTAEAEAAGIMVMPGVGFDVVPSDCIAAFAAAQLENPVELTISIGGFGRPSRGTAKTALESIGASTLVRRDGVIVPIDPAPRGKFDFGKGPQPGIAVSWGDVSTAYHTTGVPNITVYFKLTRTLDRATRMAGPMRWLMRRSLTQRLLKKAIDRQPPGPSDAEREKGYTVLVATAKDAAGNEASARLDTPEAYTLTADTSLEIAKQVANGQWEAGFRTPAGQFGADFILGFDGVSRTLL